MSDGTKNEDGTPKEVVLRIDGNEKAMAVFDAMTALKARFEKEVKELQASATAEQMSLWKQLGDAIGGVPLYERTHHVSIDEEYRESLGIVVLKYHVHERSLRDIFEAMTTGQPVDDGTPTIN